MCRRGAMSWMRRNDRGWLRGGRGTTRAADRAGRTFTHPHTRRQASAEIRRLRAQKPTSRVDRRIERRAIADAIARGPHDAAGIDLDRDVTGYGSTATWR
jgi:hypothetical protein